jgi:diketogulonate reductase-like aldo/keto reductase
LKTATIVPAVNQCDMGVSKHDDATIAYCQAHNITYEAWGAMKGCPFTNPTILSIAKAHSASAAQVCLRWGLDRGCVLAVGTGNDRSTVGNYTREDLDIFRFSLTAAEVSAINALSPGQ